MDIKCNMRIIHFSTFSQQRTTKRRFTKKRLHLTSNMEMEKMNDIYFFISQCVTKPDIYIDKYVYIFRKLPTHTCTTYISLSILYTYAVQNKEKRTICFSHCVYNSKKKMV